ncbi:DUF3100 domain-containing protein [Nocardioides albidus]|uniref:DUF3100 domain-containing protein n=1 Tax=Nocardioides albidus TaxID=1517589 RepID=A0A5C4VNE4_9ACTN|nr:DUF3100 domain-containing protein [Nocardioides albidus]TNM37398.1 DUF3100 domain-containing protein [Nocardioides albidus]
MTATPTTAHDRWTGSRIVRRLGLLGAIALVLTVVAQLVGDHTVDLGIGEITLYPLIWGLILGGAVSTQRFKPLPARLQHYATELVGIAVLVLAARLAFVVGANIPVLLDAGPALLLQELGHLFGTVLFSLPIAVALRMGRATVGACFSIDREGSFAIVADRYGADSDEYRGVLSMYVFGTVIGALYITLLATAFAEARIFDPLALAMGTGVGSGSVMAASSAAIAAEFPAQADQILALAAVSNLITTVLGLYVGMYVALPASERFYQLLTRRQSRGAATEATLPPVAAEQVTAQAAEVRQATELEPVAEAKHESVPVLPSIALILILFLTSAVIFHGSFDVKMLGGFAIMAALVLVSIWLKKLIGLSAIIGLSTIGAYLGSEWSPVADEIAKVTEPIEFLALTTPVLVLAGLGLGKDMPMLRRIGWRIVPVGLVSFAASFLVATVIGELALGLG